MPDQCTDLDLDLVTLAAGAATAIIRSRARISSASQETQIENLRDNPSFVAVVTEVLEQHRRNSQKYFTEVHYKYILCLISASPFVFALLSIFSLNPLNPLDLSS